MNCFTNTRIFLTYEIFILQILAFFYLTRVLQLYDVTYSFLKRLPGPLAIRCTLCSRFSLIPTLARVLRTDGNCRSLLYPHLLIYRVLLTYATLACAEIGRVRILQRKWIENRSPPFSTLFGITVLLIGLFPRVLFCLSTERSAYQKLILHILLKKPRP